MSMKTIFESVIREGSYNLADIISKAHEEYVANRLTAEEREEVISMAQSNAKPENGYAEANARIDQAFKDIQALQSSMEKALQEIAAIKKAVEGVGEDVEQPEEPIEEEWPEWYAWDGVTLNPWQKDSKCTHNGARYISRVDNNIWEPGATGVYDYIWEKQVE